MAGERLNNEIASLGDSIDARLEARHRTLGYEAPEVNTPSLFGSLYKDVNITGGRAGVRVRYTTTEDGLTVKRDIKITDRRKGVIEGVDEIYGPDGNLRHVRSYAIGEPLSPNASHRAPIFDHASTRPVPTRDVEPLTGSILNDLSTFAAVL